MKNIMSWIKKQFIPVFISAIFFIGLLELGSYGVLKYFKEAKINKAGMAFLNNQLVGFNDDSQLDTFNDVTTMIPNPYSLYWNNPNYQDEEYGKMYNSLGYRSNELESLGTETIRILALGGSTTNVYPFVKDNSKIWTYLVEEKLNISSNSTYHVMNAGLPYGTTAELLSHYIFKGKYTNPKYVIYHGGGNDRMPLFFPNYKTDYSHVRWSQAGAGMRNKVLKLVSYSNTLKLLTSVSFTHSPYNGSPPFKNLNTNEVLQRVKNTKELAFRENLEVLASETLRKESKLFLVGFLQAKKKNLARNDPHLIGFEDALILAVERHDNIMKGIAEKYQHVHFLKLNADRFNEEWFLDNAHLTELGEAEKAKQIADFILNHLNE